jgi:hypothetical protein
VTSVRHFVVVVKGEKLKSFVPAVGANFSGES